LPKPQQLLEVTSDRVPIGTDSKSRVLFAIPAGLTVPNQPAGQKYCLAGNTVEARPTIQTREGANIR
jgi:hypothetical protein